MLEQRYGTCIGAQYAFAPIFGEELLLTSLFLLSTLGVEGRDSMYYCSMAQLSPVFQGDKATFYDYVLENM